ncbi:hypothetical protein MOBT1_002036 [Malassezia obtusa]|uniref:Protein sum2 n=1 Tax=Malassezia obtusa TaxID=76774 RepID=A0AAF0IS99_9BASI|nr:hypothetical protein MOBT1_002036 [Malassezia obtusa]
MRYQGVLSNIDATQATLALEKAEGQPQDEVPGSEKVYDYIVFRAADVVDLRIDDPSPEKPGVAPSEPAPVAASGMPHSNMPYGNMYPPPNMYGMPPEGFGYNPYLQNPYMGMPPMPPHGAPFGMPPPHMQGFQPMTPQVPGPGSSSGFAPSPAPQPAPAPKSAVDEVQSNLGAMRMNDSAPAPQQAPPGPQKADPAKAPAQKSEPRETSDAGTKPKAHAAEPKSEGKPDSSAPKTSNRAPDAAPPVPKPAAAANESAASLAAPAVQEATVQQREKPAVPGAPAGKTVAHRDASLPEKDFDFESANARFQKELRGDHAPAPEKLDAIPAPSGPSTSFYDKKTGFFDNISSDVKERYERRPQDEAGKGRFADERARNVQTFGDNAANFRAGRGRGRGRSGRGRSRGRGRGRGGKPEWAD